MARPASGDAGLGLIEAEADRLAPPSQVEADAPDHERAALEARLERLSTQHEMGVLTNADFVGRVELVRSAMDQLELVRQVVDVPERIDWDGWSPQDVNRVLRAMWEYVQLGPDLLPVEAIWLVPEWRR